MKKVFFLCLLLASTSAMLAQPLTAQVSSPTTASVYAQQQIDLLAGFEATTGGFEAKIKLPEVTAGRWSTPLLWTPYQRTNNGITGMVGIHTHVLPTGDVLSWEGHNDNANQGHLSHAYVWNTNPNARITSNYNYPNIYSHYDNDDSNIFCSGHSFLPDGRLLVAGGHYSDGVIDRAADPLTNQPTLQNGASNPDFIPPVGSNVNSYVGLRDANIFNYKNVTYPPSPTRVWQTPATGGYLPLMAYRRWYPTATTLADGRVLVTAGQRHGGPLGTNTTIQAEIPEVYNATTNAWQSLSTAPRRLPLYPWMFQAPDGRVFNAGPNVHTGFLNPTGTGAWAAGPSHILGGTRAPATNTPNPYDYQERVAGTAVMYQPGKIMILGGNGPTGVTNTTELLNLNAATLAWQQGPPMQFARYHANATLLANGTPCS